MQIIMNTNTARTLVVKSHAMTNTVMVALADEFDEIPELPMFDEVVSAAIADSADRVNVVLTQDENHLCLTINDELFIKYFNLYIKVVNTVAPFIKPLLGLFKELKSDVSDLTDFINARK